MSDSTRREFLGRSALTTIATSLGTVVPFARFFPSELVPVAMAAGDEASGLGGTDGLSVLSDRPLNAETPPHLLDDDVTPTARLFIRNNGIVPEIAKSGDAKGWALTIDGEVKKELHLTREEMLAKYKSHTYQFVLECAGNGRAGFSPSVPGNQWTYGGIGCPLWTGVRLKDVLEDAGVKPSAVYIGYYGHDTHLSGDPKKVVISRGVPIAKALDEHTLIAFEMNGQPLNAVHGFPARLVCPGYPASTSGKWLKRIWVRDKVHDGEKMNGMAYRMPKYPLKPGEKVPEADMEIIERMPVKSLITFPRSGTAIKEVEAKKFKCRGFAWTGEKQVKDVDVSYDFGRTWIAADLKSERNRYAWRRWEATLALPTKGYYEIWARAKDDTGKMQSMVVPGWNPEGYLNNAMPRIAVTVV